MTEFPIAPAAVAPAPIPGNSPGYTYYRERPFRFARVVRMLRKRWLIVVGTAATVFVGSAFHTFTQTPQYQSTASLLIDNSKITVSPLDVPGLRDREVDMGTEIAILRSRPLIQQAVSRMKDPITGQPPDEGFVYQVLGNFVIRPERDAMVLRLSYRDPDPQRAKAVLDALSATYTEYSLTERRTRSTSAIKFIQAKLPEVRRQLDKSALAVTEFRKKYNIVDPDAYAASVFQAREQLELQAQQSQIKLEQTQRQLELLRQQIGEPASVALNTAILSQDTTYQGLLRQFQEVETNFVLERTRFQDGHPTVQALRDRREELYRLLQAQAQTVLGPQAANLVETTSTSANEIRSTLATQLFETQTSLSVQQTQLQSIRSAQEEVRAQFAQVPQLQQRFTELQRQLALDTQVHNSLNQKLEELRISEAQESSLWRVIEPAVLPVLPISPNVQQNLLYGGILGLGLGLGLAFLLDRLDERIHEVEEVREIVFDVPVLATIPRTEVTLPAASGTATLPDFTQYAFRESLSSLALNLRYLGSDQSVKLIAFTSSLPSEGKSTLIFNLAKILAELGHRVLVVDADMRKPMIHKLARTHNKFGLSTAIATTRSWRQLIQTVDAQGYLHVMTSGPIPPNPMVLLESTKMTKLLEVWQQTYDYVLVDTPPVVGISDAQSLAPRVDATVLVAAIDRSTRSAVARALEIIQACRGKVAGLLVNMINSDDSSYQYSHYSSYYYQSQLPAATEEEDDGDELFVEATGE